MMNYTSDNIKSQYPTPFYLFDSRVLKNRYTYLRDNLPKGTKLCYAIKANPFLAACMKDYIDRYEICSPGELRICLEQSLPTEKFVVSGVYKCVEDMELLASLSFNVDCCTVESVNQYKLIKEIAQRDNLPVTLLLRLTSSNQFGINKEEVEQLINDATDNELINIKGIQFYSGTQKSNLSKIKREVTMLDEFIVYLNDAYNNTIKELEYGPGFPVEYFEPSSFDEAEYLKGLSEILESMQSDVELALELGRGLAATCGTYITSVVDKKTNSSGNYAIVDGGINHLVYFGQVMAMKKPYFDLLPDRKAVDKEHWNVCGSLCTVNDILLKNIEVETLNIGDRFIFKNTGAYCVTEGISLFLSRALPSVVMVDENGEADVIREHKDIYTLNY